jgi:hypothetical protein
MIEEEKNKTGRKALPPLINIKYGDRTKKIYRLAKLKSQEFTYTNLIALIKNYKPIKSNINICLVLQKQGGKEPIIIKSENEFNYFLTSEELISCLDKTNLKIEFFYTLASPESIKQKENGEQLEKVFQDLNNDGNSKLVLDFIVDYLDKQRDFADKLYEDLKGKDIITADSNVDKNDFAKEILPGIMKNIKENYETLISARETNLNLNLSFNKAMSISLDDNEVNKEFKPFSQLYNPQEIEEFSSKIIRDTLSSIQIIK